MVLPNTHSFPTLQTQVDALQSQLQGIVITPEDARFDEARQAWNLTVDQYPAVIVLAENAADVAASVRFARDEGLEIAVQATGHGVSRPANGTLLINLARMTGVHVDATAQAAWIVGGTQWGPVLEQAQAVGLAPLLGSTPHVSAIGYTLGGGIGWLARKYGLAADSVRAFEVVSVHGDILRASANENSDLFWALRGGGGSFGVVTGMEIQLYPVDTVYAGNLYYPVEMAKAVMTRYREWIANAPEALTSSITLMNYPPLPVLPEFLRGKSYVIVRGAYTGSMEQGEELLRFWRDWQAPAVDMFGPLPFSRAAEISNDPVNPTAGLGTSVWLSDLSDDVIDTLIQYGVGKNGFAKAEVRHVGNGAINRVDKSFNAYGNRDASLVLELIGITQTEAQFRDMEAYTDEFKHALEPHLTGGVYINFLLGQEKLARTKDAFTPDNYQRLTAIKAKYDPQNVFSHSFNIPPAAESD